MEDIITAVQNVREHPEEEKYQVIVAIGESGMAVVLSGTEHLRIENGTLTSVMPIPSDGKNPEPGTYRMIIDESGHAISFDPCSFPLGNTDHTYKRMHLKQEQETLRLRKERDAAREELEEAKNDRKNLMKKDEAFIKEIISDLNKYGSLGRKGMEMLEDWHRELRGEVAIDRKICAKEGE